LRVRSVEPPPEADAVVAAVASEASAAPVARAAPRTRRAVPRVEVVVGAVLACRRDAAARVSELRPVGAGDVAPVVSAARARTGGGAIPDGCTPRTGEARTAFLTVGRDAREPVGAGSGAGVDEGLGSGDSPCGVWAVAVAPGVVASARMARQAARRRRLLTRSQAFLAGPDDDRTPAGPIASTARAAGCGGSRRPFAEGLVTRP
jgi:hypothetical protein